MAMNNISYNKSNIIRIFDVAKLIVRRTFLAAAMPRMVRL